MCEGCGRAWRSKLLFTYDDPGFDLEIGNFSLRAPAGCSLPLPSRPRMGHRD